MRIIDVSDVGISRAIPWLVPVLATVFGCSSGQGRNNDSGPIIGFATGTEAVGAVPSDGRDPAAPVISLLSSSNPTIQDGQPLEIRIDFADPQGDVATVNFGIGGQTSHSTLSEDTLGDKTSGSLALDLYLTTYTPGTYTLFVSLTDQAGHVSATTTMSFTIAGATGGADASIAAGSG